MLHEEWFNEQRQFVVQGSVFLMRLGINSDNGGDEAVAELNGITNSTFSDDGSKSRIEKDPISMSSTKKNKQTSWIDY